MQHCRCCLPCVLPLVMRDHGCVQSVCCLPMCSHPSWPVRGENEVMKWGLLSLDVMSLSRIRCCPRLSRCCRIAAPRSSWSDCRLSKSPRLAVAAAAEVLAVMMAATWTDPHVEVRVLGYDPLTGSLGVKFFVFFTYTNCLIAETCLLFCKICDITSHKASSSNKTNLKEAWNYVFIWGVFWQSDHLNVEQ